MSQLIQLRQRIKAIETTKKITHAMRLISMSSHTRLRTQEEPLKRYIQLSRSLMQKIKNNTPGWHHPFIANAGTKDTKPLIILIGSQKGLCGNFNSTLFHLFFQTYGHLITKINLIVIGKRAVDFAYEKKFSSLRAAYPEFTSRTLPTIVHELMNVILSENTPFSSVVIVSNKLKTFFIQKPQITQIIPFDHQGEHAHSDLINEEYHWEQPPTEILNSLLQQVIESQMYYLFFQSLVAEQAARFLSMDSSTRNAQSLLEQAKLQYNKLRQAKITKELMELAGNF